MAMFLISACQQDELISEATEPVVVIEKIPVSIDTVAIRKALDGVQSLSKFTVADSLKKTSTKSAEMEVEGVVDYQVFELNTLENYPVFNDHAEKVWWYNGVDESGQMVVSITVFQRFEIRNDGSVNLDSWRFRWVPYCPWPYSKNMRLESYDFLELITYNLYDQNDQLKLSYFGKRNQENINLVKVPNYYWKINAFYDNGNVPMYFTGSPNLNLTSELLELEYQFSETKIISVVQIEKDLLKNANRINFVGINPENDERINLLRPIVDNEKMAEIIPFELPIELTEVCICGPGWCRWYEVYATLVNNQIVYRLRQ